MAGDKDETTAKSGDTVGKQVGYLSFGVRALDLDPLKRGWTKKSKEGVAMSALESSAAGWNSGLGVTSYGVPAGHWVYVFEQHAAGWRLRHELQRKGSGYDAVRWRGKDAQEQLKAYTDPGDTHEARPVTASMAYSVNGVPFDPAAQHVFIVSRIQLPYSRIKHYLTDASGLTARASAVWLPEINGRLVLDTSRAQGQYGWVRPADSSEPAPTIKAGDEDAWTNTSLRRSVTVGNEATVRYWIPMREPLSYAEEIRVTQQQNLDQKQQKVDEEDSDATRTQPTALSVKLDAYSVLLYDAVKGDADAKKALEFDDLKSYAKLVRAVEFNKTKAAKRSLACTKALSRAISRSDYEAALHDHLADPKAAPYATESYDFATSGLFFDPYGVKTIARLATAKSGFLPDFLFSAGFQAVRKNAAAAECFESLMSKYLAGQAVALTGKRRARDIVDMKKVLKKVVKRLKAGVTAGHKAGRYSDADVKAFKDLRVRTGGQKSALPHIVCKKKKGTAKWVRTKTFLNGVGGPIRGLMVGIEMANLAVAVASFPSAIQSKRFADPQLAVVGVVGGFADVAGGLDMALQGTRAGGRLLGTGFGRVLSKAVSFPPIAVVGALCDYIGGVAGAARATYNGKSSHAVGHALAALAGVALGAGAVLTVQSAAAGAATAVAFGLTGPALIAIGVVLFAASTTVLWIFQDKSELLKHAEQCPWKKGMAGTQPTISEKELDTQMDRLAGLLLRYEASASLTSGSGGTVTVEGQACKGMLLSIIVKANMMLEQTRFTLSSIDLHPRTEDGKPLGETVRLPEPLPKGKMLSFQESSASNVRKRSFESGSYDAQNTKKKGIWEVRTEPGEVDGAAALLIEVALPFSYTHQPPSRLDEHFVEVKPPAEVLTQLYPGFMGLKWKGAHGFMATVCLQAHPMGASGTAVPGPSGIPSSKLQATAQGPGLRYS